MYRMLLIAITLCGLSVATRAQEQVTVQKVTINTPSGTITGKVVGTGERLVFVDDANPQNSFTLPRGAVQEYRTEDGAIIVRMARPSEDKAGTVSNLRITVVDPSSAAALTQWFEMPVERARTITTYSTDVQHDHRGKGHCTGKLIADDRSLRFESVTEAAHSRTWDYNDLRSFDKEKDHSLLKIATKNGDSEQFRTVNGATAGELYNLVAQKIVAARP